MISWKDFWQWVERNSDVARVVGLYESDLPGANPTFVPEGPELPLTTHRPPPTTQDKLRELMRFLYLRASGTRRWPMHADAGLDELWHALILQTKTYRAVCDKLGAFVDHESGQITNEEWYPDFYAEYYLAFHEWPTATIWPEPERRAAVPFASSDPDHDCA